MRVLVVEDEAKIRSFVVKGLKAEGFNVDTAANGSDARLMALQTPYDAIVLDIMIPGQDGISILKELREKRINTPVILATARGGLEDRLQGLNLGADDYLPKPFHIDELVARLRAVFRRSSGALLNLVKVEDLTINLGTREVKKGSEAVELTPREFNLLELLMRVPGRVYTRTQILETVWNYDFDPNTNLVDVYIKRLRAKVDKAEPRLIETVRGVGYRIRKG
ncbi:response regulator transcription factor [Puniceicoccales bacterium CK1056]|uniref:Response regulator transcription factor n=1 Tax=Oceanipulchritudo coccoides TaxID=2706888 RepID=A0A6B2LZE5_9BACT|nr:response regulator transcription factor [Oceanipulchritudo coccoides]NDV61436.1 response regulator transcription factor [Oceanipulchritudo coccoides]